MNDIFFKIIVPILIQPTPVKIVTILLSSVGMYFVCKKAGVDGWRGVVPPYNLFIFARIGRRSSALPIFVVVYGLFFLLGISLFMYNMDSVLLFLNVKPEEAPALIFSGVYIFYFVLPVMLVALLLCSPIFLAIFYFINQLLILSIKVLYSQLECYFSRLCTGQGLVLIHRYMLMKTVLVLTQLARHLLYQLLPVYHSKYGKCVHYLISDLRKGSESGYIRIIFYNIK